MTQIYAITEWQFWFQAIKFGLGIWLFWYLPGRFWLRKVSQLPQTAPTWALSWVIGLVFWTLLSYIFGWLQLRFLTSLICLWIAWFELRIHSINFSWPKKVNWAVIGIISFGLLVQMPAVMTSGWKTAKGLEFYFTNSEDGMMHLSLIQNLVNQFPPSRPEIAGVPLTNYHYLSDLATAELVRVLDLPIVATFFHFLPPVISILGGWLIYSLILEWQGKKTAGLLGLFFWYLGGDLGYLISVILHHDWRWFAATIDNGADQFLNPPQTFAKLIFLAGLYLVNLYWQKGSKSAWWMSVILFGVLTGFKIYFGLFAGLALIMATVFRAKNHQTKIIEWWGIGLIGMISLGLLLPSYQAGGGLKFVLLAWPKLLFSADHLDWTWWINQASADKSQLSWWRLVLVNALGFGVSLTAIFGTRIIGFFGQLKSQPVWFWFWWPAAIIFSILGLNTIQDPGGLNTFNFLVVVSVPLICFAAIGLERILSLRKPWLTAGVIIILILTPVRSLRNAVHSINALAKHDSAGRMTLPDLELARWLSQNTVKTDILQSHLENNQTSQGTYLSFFSERQTYLTGRNILVTHSLTLPDRVAILESAAKAPNYTSLQAIFKSSQIKYYLIQNKPGQKDFMDKTDVVGHTVFSNSAGWVIKL